MTVSVSLDNLIRDLFGRVALTQKTHEKERERQNRAVRRLKWLNVVISGMTALLAVTGAATQDRCAILFAALVGGLAAALQVFQLSFDPEKTEYAHRVAAKALLKVRDRLLSLIEIAMVSNNDDEVRRQFVDLQNEAHVIFDGAPYTSRWAYEQAQRALKVEGENTFSDDEIDALLPPALRKKP